MRYTEEMIERISEAATAGTLLPPPRDALELGRKIAASVSDTYTDDDWQRVLNGLSPERVAGKISRRPSEERHRLLMLLDPDGRTEVKRLLAAPAA